MRPEIIPAILPRDFAEIKDKMELIGGFAKTVQIDVCDGQFTSSPTWPYRKDDDSFEKILREEEGFPGWQNTNFEIDLMANRPEERIEDWVSAGASRIIIHAEARGDVAGAISALTGRVEVGLALNMETDIAVITEHLAHIQFVQLMGIDHIGFQGQEFDTAVIDKIKAVKAAHPDLIISVDGGVSLDTAPQLLEAGANRLVVGSAIFGSDNPIEAIREFKAL